MATTIKYNLTNGDSVWIKRDTGTYSRANNNAIIVDSSGNCYTTGGNYNLGLFPFDIMSRKYSEIGNSMWFIIYNGPFNGIDYGVDLALDNLRNLYVLATSESGAGIRDYIVIKYNQLTNINPISYNIPLKFILQQNYPNPFNPMTKIKYALPYASNVTLKVYNILGREVISLVNEFKDAGSYIVEFNGKNYASGVYFYRIEAEVQNGRKYVERKKMVLVK
ncbi:MAG: T9SS type A sorting domain-containing protein [Ignavibacteria bacterium]|nr:T9SS type A sorting domain-containing protein [Ignavibacteria bacterium]